MTAAPTPAGSLELIGRTITIVYTDRDFGEGQFGQWDRFQQTIEVRPGMCREATVACVVHELLEAINDWFSVGLREAQIERLESALYPFLEAHVAGILFPESGTPRYTGTV